MVWVAMRGLMRRTVCVAGARGAAGFGGGGGQRRREVVGTRSAAGTHVVSGGTWGTPRDAGADLYFSGPRVVASDGIHVWVANSRRDSVTELKRRGPRALVKVIT